MVTMGGAVVVSEGAVEVVAAVEAVGGAEAVAAAVTCVLVVLCFLLGARYIRQCHQYWQRRGVPCPPATPLLGHTLARMGLTRPFMEFFDELYYDYNGRDYCGFYDLLKPGLFVGNPQLIKTILVQDFQYFADRRTFDLSKVSPVANDMLTNARGAHWRRIRSAVSPAFTKNRTRRLYPLLFQRARHFLRLIGSIQQDQRDQITPEPTSAIRDPTSSKTERESTTETGEPEISGVDKVRTTVRMENIKQVSRYLRKRTAVEDPGEEKVKEIRKERHGYVQRKARYSKKRTAVGNPAKEIMTENEENVEQKSNYSAKRTVAEEEAEEAMNITAKSRENVKEEGQYLSKIEAEEKELDTSTLPRETQQQILAVRTATTTATTTTTRTALHHAPNTKYRQMDAPDPAPNGKLISTSPAASAGNTHIDASLAPTCTQNRHKKHDTNNNSTGRSTVTTRADVGVQTDTQTHSKETDTAAMLPRREKTVSATATATATATAEDPATRYRGSGKATREELKRKDDIEARRMCGRFAMDAIASCAFGLDCEALDKEAALFPIMAARVLQLSPTRALKMLLVSVSPRAAQMATAAGVRYTSEEFTFFLRVAKHALAARRAAHTPRGDVLDLLLEAAAQSKQGLSDDTLAAQAILFLLAGYDNTANTLAMSLHLLAHHPAAKARLRRELSRAILKSGGSGGGRLTYEEVTELPYLDAVVCETLRLYPAAPVIERVCTEPCRLGGVEVAAGTGVVVPVWSLHRDPAHWPRPHHFIPERFLREARLTHTPYTYLPFGTGPRSCVGVRFAQVVVKAGLAAILAGADVIPSPASPYPALLDPRVLTLQPKDGLYVNLKPTPLPDMLERELHDHPPLCAEDEATAADLRELLASGVAKGVNIELLDGLIA